MRKDLHFSFLLVFFLKYVVNINSVQNGCEFFTPREMKLDVFVVPRVIVIVFVIIYC